MLSLIALDELRRRLSCIEKALLQGFEAGETRAMGLVNPYLPETAEYCAWRDGRKISLWVDKPPDYPPDPL